MLILYGLLSHHVVGTVCICYPSLCVVYYYYYYLYSALGPVCAETKAQSGDWCDSGTLHPGQVLRGSLPLLSPLWYNGGEKCEPGRPQTRTASWIPKATHI